MLTFLLSMGNLLSDKLYLGKNNLKILTFALSDKTQQAKYMHLL